MTNLTYPLASNIGLVSVYPPHLPARNTDKFSYLSVGLHLVFSKLDFNCVHMGGYPNNLSSDDGEDSRVKVYIHEYVDLGFKTPAVMILAIVLLIYVLTRYR